MRNQVILKKLDTDKIIDTWDLSKPGAKTALALIDFDFSGWDANNDAKDEVKITYNLSKEVRKSEVFYLSNVEGIWIASKKSQWDENQLPGLEIVYGISGSTNTFKQFRNLVEDVGIMSWSRQVGEGWDRRYDKRNELFKKHKNVLEARLLTNLNR